jgi:hypothetical protein
LALIVISDHGFASLAARPAGTHRLIFHEVRLDCWRLNLRRSRQHRLAIVLHRDALDFDLVRRLWMQARRMATRFAGGQQDAVLEVDWWLPRHVERVHRHDSAALFDTHPVHRRFMSGRPDNPRIAAPIVNPASGIAPWSRPPLRNQLVPDLLLRGVHRIWN